MRSFAAFCGALAALPVLAGCGAGSVDSQAGHVVQLPEPGLPHYQQLAAVTVPEGTVSPAGGNYMHRRVDFSIDTLLGTRPVGAVYNTADDRWRWSWEYEYSHLGLVLVDETGASYPLVETLAPGSTVANRLFPGGRWVRIDLTRMRSVGGLVHEFHPTGRLAAIYWQSADYPRLVYHTRLPGGAGVHVRVEQCTAPGSCSLVYTIERDFLARVTALEDRAGRRAEFAYDAEGRLAAARDPLDLEQGWPGRRYEWWGPRLAAIVSSDGDRTELATAWLTGRVLEVRRVGPQDRVHRFHYENAMGAQPPGAPVFALHHRDPEGHTTTIRADGYRRPRLLRRPSGATTRFDYTRETFELAAVENPDGTRTRWSFTGESQVVRTEPSGNVAVLDYRIDGGENRAAPFRRPVERITDSVGLVEERGYDSFGRLTWIDDGAGERTHLAYDAGNQVASVTLPDGLAIRFGSYGEHGHAATLSVAGETQLRAFDSVGNRLAAIGLDRLDPRRGGRVARQYDADRNVARVWLAATDPAVPVPVPEAIHIAYRSDGRPLSIVRPGGADHAFDYDAGGLLVGRRERVDGGWTATAFERDRSGRLTAETLANGMRRERSFTPDGELAGVRNLRGGVVESEATLSWMDGRLIAIDDTGHAGPETFAYDTAGRLAAVSFPDGETLELGHDARSRRTLERYRAAGGAVLAELGFGYDLADRLDTLHESARALLTRTYQDGHLVHESLGNGLSAAHSYDPDTALATGQALSDASGTLATIAVSRVVSGANASIEVTTTTTSPLGTTGESHELGPLGAIAPGGKRVQRTGGDAFAFDPLGNLLQAGPDIATYNPERNRLLSLGALGGTPIAYASDAAGYVTSRDGVALAWSADGRIASIGADRFDHDALGRPLGHTLGGVVRGRAFGGRVEADAAGLPLALDLGAVMLDLAGGGERYRHVDARGNVALVSDAAGDVVAHYHHDGYGSVALLGQDDGARSFAQGRLVQGLTVLGPRVLDPWSARFLAPDPVFQLTEQFGYAGGNPVGWWDPGGREATPAVRMVIGQAKAAAGVAILFGGAALGTVLGALGQEALGVGVAGGLAAAGATLLGDGLSIVVGAVHELADPAATSGGRLELEPPAAPSGVGSPGSGASPDPGGCGACGATGDAGNSGAGFGAALGGYGAFGAL